MPCDDEKAAIADYSLLIDHEPNSTRGYLSRAALLLDNGRPSEAIDDCTEALRIEPKYAGALALRGDAYAAQGNLKRAIADYTEAIALRPGWIVAYRNRAEAYQKGGDKARAIADYQTIVRLDPKNMSARFALKDLGVDISTEWEIAPKGKSMLDILK